MARLPGKSLPFHLTGKECGFFSHRRSAGFITDTVRHDTDDPAIWINPVDPAKSLVIGTDKDQDGGLYVFNLKGKIVKEIHDLKRPNNVDVAYGMSLSGKPTYIAVTTERFTHKLRVFSLPDMKSVDNGGLDMFVGDTGEGFRDLMGIALYKSRVGVLYTMVGRKSDPTDGSYIGQYRLDGNGVGQVKATLVRKFGTYSGRNEIESIAETMNSVTCITPTKGRGAQILRRPRERIAGAGVVRQNGLCRRPRRHFDL